MRGERISRLTIASSSAGSSPHARGTRVCCLLSGGFLRFIPACAGNAVGGRGVQFLLQVHPRMRGERMRNVSRLPLLVGSSPHARGTRLRTLRCTRPGAVHPRMRGERLHRSDVLSSGPGSSPHARGTPELPGPARMTFRFIPACAGNAISMPGGIVGGTVHPRMRGERSAGFPSSPSPSGSSPHARGTHFQ